MHTAASPLTLTEDQVLMLLRSLLMHGYGNLELVVKDHAIHQASLTPCLRSATEINNFAFFYTEAVKPAQR